MKTKVMKLIFVGAMVAAVVVFIFTEMHPTRPHVVNLNPEQPLARSFGGIAFSVGADATCYFIVPHRTQYYEIWEFSPKKPHLSNYPLVSLHNPIGSVRFWEDLSEPQ